VKKAAEMRNFALEMNAVLLSSSTVQFPIIMTHPDLLEKGYNPEKVYKKRQEKLSG
jgi:hypothetical protein